MRMSVEIVQVDRGGQGLRIFEEYPFEANNFAALAEVMAKFHELAEALRSRKK